MTRHDNRTGMLALGWGFILFGLLGLMLPVLLAILFLAIGALLLSRESGAVRRFVARMRERYPAMADAFDRAEARVRRLGRGGGDRGE